MFELICDSTGTVVPFLLDINVGVFKVTGGYFGGDTLFFPTLRVASPSSLKLMSQFIGLDFAMVAVG